MNVANLFSVELQILQLLLTINSVTLIIIIRLIITHGSKLIVDTFLWDWINKTAIISLFKGGAPRRI